MDDRPEAILRRQTRWNLSEIVEATGIGRRRLDRWIDTGLIPQPQIVLNKRRYYGAKEAAKVIHIVTKALKTPGKDPS